MRARSFARLGIGLLFVVIGGSAFVAEAGDRWHNPHRMGVNVDRQQRPECPQAYSSDTLPFRPLVRIAGEPTRVIIPSSGIPGVEPITDIPEFHDCQRFIGDDGEFAQLMSVFASSSLENTFAGIPLDTLVWTTSNAAVVSVSAAGVVTAAAPGVAVVTATSNTHPAIKASAAINVQQNAPPAPGAVTLAMGAPTPLSLAPGGSIRLGAALSPTPTTTPIRAAAIVYNYDGAYPHLGVEAGFSCLYVFANANRVLEARMVAVRAEIVKVKDCDVPKPVSAVLASTKLTVFRTPAKRLKDVPAAARWDFDPVNKKYYIGLKCGAGWCEIGAGTDAAHPLTPSDPLPLPDGTPYNTIVQQVKGWYDQQVLALPVAGGDPIPSGIKATVVPDPGLGGWTDGQYYPKTTQASSLTNVGPTWVTSAYIGIDVSNAVQGAAVYYEKEFNFRPTSTSNIANTNKVSFCYGTRGACDIPFTASIKGCKHWESLTGRWSPQVWARFDAAGNEPPVYRCSTRRVSPSGTAAFVIPTARWRWKVSDETIWTFCAQGGCCESEGEN